MPKTSHTGARLPEERGNQCYSKAEEMLVQSLSHVCARLSPVSLSPAKGHRQRSLPGVLASRVLPQDLAEGCRHEDKCWVRTQGLGELL